MTHEPAAPDAHDRPDVGYPPAPYTWPPYPPPYPPPRPGSIDGFAVAAFVLGLCGFVWVTPVLAIVFGLVAVRRTRRSGQDGRALALAGITLASVWIVVLSLLATVAALDLLPTPEQ